MVEVVPLKVTVPHYNRKIKVRTSPSQMNNLHSKKSQANHYPQYSLTISIIIINELLISEKLHDIEYLEPNKL